jgi:hypothetical protein
LMDIGGLTFPFTIMVKGYKREQMAVFALPSIYPRQCVLDVLSPIACCDSSLRGTLYTGRA